MSLYNIIVIGETGTGKSSLCDLLAGKHLFQVSDSAESCTFKTICYRSEKDPEIGIIDTPGLQDSNGSDKDHYDQMVKIIKSLKNLNLIVVALNYTNCRLTSSIQYMLKFLCMLFPNNISEHIAIVFTHYDDEYERKKAKKYKIDDPSLEHKNKYIPEVMKLIHNTTGEEVNKSVPTFFLDSEYICNGNIVEKDTHTLMEITHLLSYAKMRSPIPTINDKANIKYKKEEEEFEERKESKEENNKIITIITKYKRIKYTNYDNSIAYSDWEKVGEPTITEKEIENKKSDVSKYLDLANNILSFLNKNSSSNENKGGLFSSILDSGSNDNSPDNNDSILSKIADQVIKGEFDYGIERERKLKEAGFDYKTIQKIVNSKLSANKKN